MRSDEEGSGYGKDGKRIVEEGVGFQYGVEKEKRRRIA